MEMREGRLVTRVRLEGRRFTVFEDALIDTGASFTVIPPAIADFLELETYGKSPQIPLTTASGLIEVPVRVLGAINVGTQRVEELSVGKNDLRRRATDRRRKVIGPMLFLLIAALRGRWKMTICLFTWRFILITLFLLGSLLASAGVSAAGPDQPGVLENHTSPTADFIPKTRWHWQRGGSFLAMDFPAADAG